MVEVHSGRSGTKAGISRENSFSGSEQERAVASTREATAPRESLARESTVRSERDALVRRVRTLEAAVADGEPSQAALLRERDAAVGELNELRKAWNDAQVRLPEIATFFTHHWYREPLSRALAGAVVERAACSCWGIFKSFFEIQATLFILKTSFFRF